MALCLILGAQILAGPALAECTSGGCYDAIGRFLLMVAVGFVLGAAAVIALGWYIWGRAGLITAIGLVLLVVITVGIMVM